MNVLPTVHWVTRRYRLSDFDEKELNASVKTWVRERGFSVVAMPKFDLLKHYWAKSYSIATSWRSLLTKLTIALYVGYRAPFLYVFSTSHLPPALSNIFDEVFTAYAHGRAGDLVQETPLAFSTSYLMTSPLSYFESLKVDYSLQVRLEPQLERIETATEEIHVPVGVNVTVKRSRTVKHAVEITMRETDGSEVKAGLKLGQLEILSATIRSEVQSQAGRRIEEAETIEYEVSLSGDKSEAYRLAWADLVRVGVVEIHEAGTRTVLPFRCRERTELDVVPVECHPSTDKGAAPA